MEKSRSRQQDHQAAPQSKALPPNSQSDLQSAANPKHPKVTDLQLRKRNKPHDANNLEIQLPSTSQGNKQLKKQVRKDFSYRREQGEVPTNQNQPIQTESNKYYNNHQKPQLLVKNLQKKHQLQLHNNDSSNPDISKNQQDFSGHQGQQQQQQLLPEAIDSGPENIQNLLNAYNNSIGNRPDIDNNVKVEERLQIEENFVKNGGEGGITSNSNNNVGEGQNGGNMGGDQQINNMASSKIMLENNSQVSSAQQQQNNVRGRFMREHMQDFIVKQNEQKKQMKEILEQQIQEKKKRQQEERQKEIDRETREEMRIQKELSQLKLKDDLEKNKEQKRLNSKPSLPILQKIDFGSVGGGVVAGLPLGDQDNTTADNGSISTVNKQHQLSKAQSSKDMIQFNNNANNVNNQDQIDITSSKVLMGQSMIQRDMKFNNLINVPSSAQLDISSPNNLGGNSIPMSHKQKINQISQGGGTGDKNLAIVSQFPFSQQSESLMGEQQDLNDDLRQAQEETIKMNELRKENQQLQDQLSKNEALIEMLIGNWKKNHRSDNVRKEALKQLAYRGFSLGNDGVQLAKPGNFTSSNSNSKHIQITPNRGNGVNGGGNNGNANNVGSNGTSSNTNDNNNNNFSSKAISRNGTGNGGKVKNHALSNNNIQIGNVSTGQSQHVNNNPINNLNNSESQRKMGNPLKLNINNLNENPSEYVSGPMQQPPKTSQDGGGGLTYANKLKHLSMIPGMQFNSNFSQLPSSLNNQILPIPRVLKSSTPYKSFKSTIINGSGNNNKTPTNQMDQIAQLNSTEFETPQEVFMMEKKIQNLDTIHNLQPFTNATNTASNTQSNLLHQNFSSYVQQQPQQLQFLAGQYSSQQQQQPHINNENALGYASGSNFMMGNFNNANVLSNNNQNNAGGVGNVQKELFSNAFEYYMPGGQTGFSGNTNFKYKSIINSNQQTPVSGMYSNNQDHFFPSPSSFYSNHMSSPIDTSQQQQQQQQQQLQLQQQQSQAKQQMHALQGVNMQAFSTAIPPNLSPLSQNQKNSLQSTGIASSTSATNLKCIALKNFKLPQEFLGSNLNKKFQAQ